MSNIYEHNRYKAVITKWVDGDSAYLLIDLGLRTKHESNCRLVGFDNDNYDTSEIFRPQSEEEKQHGLEAKEFAKSLCPVGTEVQVRTWKSGFHNRWLAAIRLPDGRDFAKVMIENGFQKR